MQIGGVGSGHDTYSHQVTECLHEHAGQTDTGSMANKMADSQTTQTATEILQDTSNENMMSWVQKIGNSGKQLYRRSGERARKLMMRSLHKMATEIILQGRRRWSPGIL